VIDVAHRMGIRSGLWRGADYYGYTVALGGGEVQPLEHTNAYATFANGGKYVPLTPIVKIVDGTSGRTIEELDRQGALAAAKQVISPEIAYQIISIMTDNDARAPEYGLNNPLIVPELNRPAGAKTGTTNDARDVWTMGYTTDLAVGVWVGNSNNAAMNGVLGASGAAPIWHDFMVEAHRRPELARHLVDPHGQPPPTDFARPPGIVEAEVCTATGKKPVGATFGQPPGATPGQQPGGFSFGPRTRKDFFPQGQPSQPCDELTPEENDELVLALLSIRSDAGKYAPGGIQSVQEYRAAVRNFRPPPGLVEPSPSPRR
jgi:membrane peptidoglycan carboxypeptidase